MKCWTGRARLRVGFSNEGVQARRQGAIPSFRMDSSALSSPEIGAVSPGVLAGSTLLGRAHFVADLCSFSHSRLPEETCLGV